MFSRGIFNLILLIAISFGAGAAIQAQNAPVAGKVELKKADGTRVPVAGALVEVYRTDIKASFPSDKTDKKGYFSFAGLPLGSTFVLSVSAPGAKPGFLPGIRPGGPNTDKLLITLEEGDGRRWTEEEIRDALSQSTSSTQSNEPTAEQKKQQEEYNKKVAEINAKNKKIQEGDDIARRANSEGIEALKVKNYDLAITKFDEGITAVPDFVGSTPIMQNGKLVALKARGFDKYREGAPLTDLEQRRAKYDSANKDFDDALKAYDQAMAIIKAAPAAASPAEQKQRDAVTLELLTNAMEVHRLKAVSGIDGSKADDAAKVIEQYISLEPDAAKKVAARTTLGDIMRTSGQFDKAIAAYKTVLESSPDNLEVMASLGLSLVALGTSVDPPNKDQLQEGLNYMAKYAETVQILPTDPKNVQEFKQSVKDTVEYLKTDQKLKAQPTKAPVKKGKG